MILMDKVLIDKSYRNYEYTSRYTKFPVYYNTVDNKYVYGLTSQLKINGEIKQFEYKVKPDDSLDSIALTYYGRPDLFWIIADYNRITDCLEPLIEKHSTLIIPSMVDIEYM